MEVSPELFRAACEKFPTGVTVITTIDEAGQTDGMVTSALQSVSTTPPLVLLAIDRESHAFQSIERLGRFGMNIMADDQTPWVEHFLVPPGERAGPPPGELRVAPSGVAIVEGSLAFMDCRVVERHDVGGHALLLAEAEGVEASDAMPLIFHEGDYLSMS